jgi:uncharacterized phage protein (TIGR01671 family)
MIEPKYRAWFLPGEKFAPARKMFYDIQREADGLTFEHFLDDGERFVIMQFTGLRDRNGKDIYEADVLNFGRDYYHKDKDLLYEVDMPYIFYSLEHETSDINDRFMSNEEVRKKFPAFEMPQPGYQQLVYLDCEVVGNVHENPKLLKVTK